MECDVTDHQDRVYLPPEAKGIKTKEYLCRYIEREFPEAADGKNAVYSVPRAFKKHGEMQASLAEEVVFTRLRALAQACNLQGLWLIFFHSASYAGHSFRNNRVGKLMIREHDFVVFARYKGKHFMVLIEVKSTKDTNTTLDGVEITSDAKVIKNNKRSAQHQLRDHMEILNGVLQSDNIENLIQSYIMWPFLGSQTRDPKQAIIKRWKEDGKLHVFQEPLSNQNKFNEWFNSVLCSNQIDEEKFFILLNRYIVLSCGVFMDEINEGMLALLTQEQLELITSNVCCKAGGGPVVVHGAAGTGKTLLVLRKLQQLHQLGQLNAQNKALCIFYWPGIKCEFEQKLDRLGLKNFVDTTRYYISQTGFLQRNKATYKHIFMDEAEAICLSFDEAILSKTMKTIFQRYHDGNCKNLNCEEFNSPTQLSTCKSIENCDSKKWGELWFLVDINQVSLFLPKHTPQILKTPTVLLTKVMRSTGYIFNVFKNFYSNSMPVLPQTSAVIKNLQSISIGHHILGPPIYWVSLDKQICSKDMSDQTQYIVVNVIIDLCATKGFKPNDLCVLPFLVNDKFLPDSFNQEIDQHFVTNGYRPKGVGDVEKFLSGREVNDFLISWALRVKGLEFKVVVIVIEDDDFDITDSEDRKKIYIMTSRSTCMLILISTQSVREVIDLSHLTEDYPFSVRL